MTEPTPDNEPGRDPDDPDLDDPLIAEDTVNRCSEARDGAGGGTQAQKLLGDRP